jgi:predicted MFS family arabinose efflux permease
MDPTEPEAALADRHAQSVFRNALSGAAATASGNGLARFAYVPLFPAMIGAGWVNGVEAGTLGAVTLLGSVIGTIAGRRVALRLGVPRLLDLGMCILVVSLLACAWNAGFWWLAAWRGLAGVGGGLLMAIAGPAAVAAAPKPERGFVGGIVVSGVGLGIAAGALAVPAFLRIGDVAAAWAGLAAAVALLWLAARQSWPRVALPTLPSAARENGLMLIITYALHSAGMVPPMVYLSDLAVRGHHFGVQAGSLIWFVFGSIGVVGGIMTGRLVDRLGSARVLKGLLGVQVVSLGLCLLPFAVLIVPAAALAGFAAVGITTVTLAHAQKIAGDRAQILWVRCTAVFSVTQAIAGFVLAGIFAASGESHFLIFAFGLFASIGALLFSRFV